MRGVLREHHRLNVFTRAAVLSSFSAYTTPVLDVSQSEE